MRFSILLLLLLSSASFGLEPICEELGIKDDQYRIPEVRFTKEEILKSFKVLKKYLNDGYTAEEEFLSPHLIFINGGILRNQAETSRKKAGATYEFYKNKFCKFWETEAYMDI